jgi:hypothetical protein
VALGLLASGSEDCGGATVGPVGFAKLAAIASASGDCEGEAVGPVELAEFEQQEASAPQQ